MQAIQDVSYRDNKIVCKGYLIENTHQSCFFAYNLRKRQGGQDDLLFRRLRAWIGQGRNRNYTLDIEDDLQIENGNGKELFSPYTYRNPLILYMKKIIADVISQKNISYQRLELIVIDAEEDREQDADDIQNILYEMGQRLNYLLLVTDRPDRYQTFTDEMYEENGLIVQQISKSACRQARGNVVLDFERSSYLEKNAVCLNAIYLPIYKRPWEISENLDILVPVGYNTLVVDGILPADWQEQSYMSERDRLDREFRKG